MAQLPPSCATSILRRPLPRAASILAFAARPSFSRPSSAHIVSPPSPVTESRRYVTNVQSRSVRSDGPSPRHRYEPQSRSAAKARDGKESVSSLRSITPNSSSGRSDVRLQYGAESPSSPLQPLIMRLAKNRRFQAGDVYTPYDLLPQNSDSKYTGAFRPTRDVFDELGINPLDEYKVRVCRHIYLRKFQFCGWQHGMWRKVWTLRLTE